MSESSNNEKKEILESVTAEGHFEFINFIENKTDEEFKELYNTVGLEWNDYLGTAGAAYAKTFAPLVAGLGIRHYIFDTREEKHKAYDAKGKIPFANFVSASSFGAAIAAANIAYDIYVSEDITTYEEFSKKLTDSTALIVGGSLATEGILSLVARIGFVSLTATTFAGFVAVTVGLAFLGHAYDALKKSGNLDSLYDLTLGAVEAIAELRKNPRQAWQEFLDGIESVVSPLVFDLDGNGIEATSVSSGVYFDHNNDGIKELTAFVDSGDGLLALDIDQNGTIDNGGELFGNNTLLTGDSYAENGFLALARYDDGRDAKWLS